MADAGSWITTDTGAHVLIGADGTPQGNSPAAVALREKGNAKSVTHSEQTPTPSAKSVLAKQSAVYVGKDVQRYSEEHNEPKLAKALGGESLKDNEPVDIKITGKGGGVEHGVEMKTKTVGGGDQVFMKSDAQARKGDWQARNNAAFHTVVFDDKKVYNAKGAGQHDESQRTIYYKRGYGSFKVSAMHVAKDTNELKTLMNTPTHELPKAAQPPKSYREPVQ